MSNDIQPAEKFYPDTYIKDVAIEISSDYQFDNSPHGPKKAQKAEIKPFIGRKEEIEKFKQMLSEGKGVFLVTGYRGMGKTSFVNQVISNFDTEKPARFIRFKRLTTKWRKIFSRKEKLSPQKISIHITISQKQPSEIEVLRLIVSAILENLKTDLQFVKKNKSAESISFLVRLLGTATLLLLSLFLWKFTDLKNILIVEKFKWFNFDYAKSLDVLRYSMLGGIIFTGILYLIKRNTNKFPALFLQIETLFKRCYSSTTFEKGGPQDLTIESLNTKLTGNAPKKTENYPVASSKEIEHELYTFLKAAKTDKESPKEFIFIFDELDKVEQNFGEHISDIEHEVNKSKYNPEKAYIEQLRERKWAILNIITGLKNFLTSSEASFIFIAGREMFDASMADIADRQSSISSIFSYVFYVESFLKQRHEYQTGGDIYNTSSLSSSIELYLYQIIHGYATNNPDDLYRRKTDSDFDNELQAKHDKHANYTDELRKLKFWRIFYPDKVSEIESKISELEREIAGFPLVKENYSNNYLKVNLLMQSFVVYLTYRSNGSPKKLIRTIHEFIKIGISQKELEYKIHWINNSNSKTNRFLYFNYKNQQRIGFINFIYSPFLVKYGNSIKKYSDNLVVSTSYLFDHFLKFHPFAFSLTHLELMPEVLSTNRTPALRDHIKKIIDFLSNNHVKETEIGLFDYKFYSRTVNEIFYLSKTFEEESAAFNFTLDESYMIKLHVKGKLRELRTIYEKYVETSDNVSQLIFSIAYLNGILGDLHFFDQEYDDAVIAYSDVIKPIRSLDVTTMNMRDLVTLLRYKLKLGLTFEKIKSYEEALSFYTDAAQEAKGFVVERLQGKYVQDDLPRQYYNELSNDRKQHYISSSLSDILQIINQAFLAQMVIQEKMGVEGITGKKSAITMGAFLHLAKSIEIHCGPNTTILANFFLQIGNLLYFKNSTKAFEWEPGYESRNPIPYEYRQEIKELIECHERFCDPIETKPNKKIKRIDRKPVIALSMYFIGLKKLLEHRIMGFAIEYSKGNTITYILDKLSGGNFTQEAGENFKQYSSSLSKIHYKYIAIFLSHIGDCMLSMIRVPAETDGFFVEDIVDPIALKSLLDNVTSNHGEELSEDRFISLRKLASTKQGSDADKEITVLNIICYFYLSAYYFKKCSRSRSYSFQLRKILYVIRLVVKNNQDDDKMLAISEDFCNLIEKTIVTELLEVSSDNAEHADVHEFNKFEVLLENSAIKNSNIFLRNNMSNFPDTRETILLFQHIKLKLMPSKHLDQTGLIRSDYSIATQYLRLLELTFAAKLYDKRLKTKDYKVDTTSSKLNDTITFLHSLVSIINIMDIYDNDYLVGSSFLAYHHFRIAEFFTFNGTSVESSQTHASEKINDFRVSESDAELAKKAVMNISGDASSHSLFDKHYHYKMAAMYYDRSIKLHSAGSDYKKAINEILYLEDDLNDASYHFGAAMDRYLMVNGILHAHLSKCQKNKIGPADDFKSYLTDQLPETAAANETIASQANS